MAPDRTLPTPIPELVALRNPEKKDKEIIIFLTLQYTTSDEQDYPILHTHIYCAPPEGAANLDEFNTQADTLPMTHIEGADNHAKILDNGGIELPNITYFTREEDRDSNEPVLPQTVSVIFFPTPELAQSVARHQHERPRMEEYFALSDFDPSRPAIDISSLSDHEIYLLEGIIPPNLWNQHSD